MKRLYSDTIINQTPRLLSLLDRNPYSVTYGCFDRSFWHNKLTDFPSARFQEACLTLVLLYKHSFKNNPYYQNLKLKTWALASLDFWAKTQSANGSYSEWYPHEQSFVATAFSLYAATETLLALKQQPSDSLLKAIVKAANWLAKQPLGQVSNQQAGSILALHNVYLITKQAQYREASQKKLTYLLSTQTKEGWFPEYNGADIGYSSVLLDYLAKYYQKTKAKKVLSALTKLEQFLAYFSHPNLTFGGDYGSRNTQYLLPDGLAILNSKLLTPLLKSIDKYPLNLDDRYLCYNGYTFLQAYLSLGKTKPKSAKNPAPKLKHFPKAGLLVHANSAYYFVINLKKGGSFKLYNQKTKKLITESSGIIGKLSNQKIVTSHWLDPDYQISIDQNQVSVSGNLHYLKNFTTRPLSMICSRLFQLTLGKSQTISKLTKSMLRKLLITSSSTAPISFKNQFTLTKTKINQKITLTIKDQSQFESLSLNQKFSHIYVPSSRFFHPEELNLKQNSISVPQLSKLNQTKALIRVTSF